MYLKIVREIERIIEDRVKLPLYFKPEKLLENLARLQNTQWTEHFVKQNYEGDWSAIPLRSPIGETHPIRMIYSDPACREFVDTPFLKICPYFQEVLSAFQCRLGAVRLMKLAPNSVIKEHADFDLSFEDGMIRLHIPVKTNPGVEFYLNGERVLMEAGECWYLRLSDPHRAVNNSPENRVHLVIDAVVNNWVREILT